MPNDIVGLTLLCLVGFALLPFALLVVFGFILFFCDLIVWAFGIYVAVFRGLLDSMGEFVWKIKAIWKDK